MNSDGWGQVGAGQSDMRIAGQDLQHHNQTTTRDRASRQSGGPMKEALDAEMKRHTESRSMRMKHLEEHYKR